MNRETFLDTLKTQYSEEIHEAYLECEHAGKVDLAAFNQRLAKIMKNAATEGLPRGEFEEMVRSAFPDVAAQIQFGAPAGKKAA